MVFLYFPTWISSFCLHVWHSLPFLQKFSGISNFLHLFHNTAGGVLSGFTIMLSNFVAMEMTSHKNSPLPFESIPACVSMAHAVPINVGILLSATEFC